MRYRSILTLLLATAACSQPVDRAPGSAPDPDALSPAAASSAIRAAEAFGEPIWLEIWGHARSPTADDLAELGYLSVVDDRQDGVRLTEKGKGQGVEEKWFHEGTPVYRFPLASRELVSVTEIEQHGGVRRVAFVYRQAANAIGRGLIAKKSHMGGIELGGELEGTAVLIATGNGWRVTGLDL